MAETKAKISLDILDSMSKEEVKRKTKILAGILKNLQQWLAYVEDEGLFFITIEGEEYFVYDLLEGFDLLPERQREAVYLICIQNMKEADAARQMGFEKWTTPAQQYNAAALKKLLAYHEAKDRGISNV